MTGAFESYAQQVCIMSWIIFNFNSHVIYLSVADYCFAAKLRLNACLLSTYLRSGIRKDFTNLIFALQAAQLHEQKSIYEAIIQTKLTESGTIMLRFKCLFLSVILSFASRQTQQTWNFPDLTKSIQNLVILIIRLIIKNFYAIFNIKYTKVSNKLFVCMLPIQAPDTYSPNKYFDHVFVLSFVPRI